MTRKSPGHVRAALPFRRAPGVRIALVDGVSARGLSQIARLERTDMRPGAAAEALKAWRDFAHASADERADMLFYGQACCPDPRDDREVLERVLRVLPPKDARALRRRIGVLDDRIGSVEA